MSEQQFNVVLDSFVLTFKGLKTIGPDGSITCSPRIRASSM